MLTKVNIHEAIATHPFLSQYKDSVEIYNPEEFDSLMVRHAGSTLFDDGEDMPMFTLFDEHWGQFIHLYDAQTMGELLQVKANKDLFEFFC